MGRPGCCPVTANSRFQTPCNFDSQKQGSITSLCLFLAVPLRRKRRGMGKRFTLPFSPVSCSHPTSSFCHLWLSPELCGWTRDYCSNTFLEKGKKGGRSRGKGKGRFPTKQGAKCSAPSQAPEIKT